jgi:3-dehydroquinate synthase
MDKSVSVSIAPISTSLTQYLSKNTHSSVAILVDENTEDHCLPLLSILEDYHLIKIQSGEINKTLSTCEQIWQAMTDAHLDRQSLLINVGGGVIGDMGGFCAATYKRGIDFINIPTTLLSMVDASIGGKLGIDFGQFKNHIGIFQSPQAVLVDPYFLKTLPKREVRSGYAEVIKHALITSKGDWTSLSSFSIDTADWAPIIQRAIEIKSDVVAQDWKEQGLRKTLNFGHTIGHAIESYFLESNEVSVLHGEAVAAGMICELYLSVQNSNFSSVELNTIERYLLNIYGKLTIDESDYSDIAQLATQDKKNKKGKIQGVLLKEIGTPIIDSVISTEEIIKALHYYNSLNI